MRRPPRLFGGRLLAELPVAIQVRTGPTITLCLRGKAAGVLTPEGLLEFNVGGEHAQYLTSSGHTRFQSPPAETALALHAAESYVLRGHARVTAGRAELWLIQYDQTSRLEHARTVLTTGDFVLRFKTAANYDRCVVALRLLGQGSVGLSDLTLEQDLPTGGKTSGILTGPQAGFQAYSIFFDPVGYGNVSAAPHGQPEHEPQTYTLLATELSGCRRVLELDCGSGRLLEALRQAGVTEVIALERNPDALEERGQLGLTIHTHDLNLPFPFIPAACCDAVIALYSIEYLAPIAQRSVLRECRRVLRPGGKLLIIAAGFGPRARQSARAPTPLSVTRLREWLHEAGLVEREIKVDAHWLHCTASAPAEAGRWPARTVRLLNGQSVRPWAAPDSPLASRPNGWDNASARDFTPLTNAQKDLLRLDGQYVAYYTGYRVVAEQVQRAIMRCTSADGVHWERTPLEPVLTAGAAQSWDSGGVAAGSVLPSPDPRHARYVMYYTGRDETGVWPGIGLAFSDDGVHWERLPQRILRVEDYPSLRYLALADVICLDNGRWLMHCEGWLTQHDGWSIVQAESDDGLTWRPTQSEPVLHPASVPWAGRHVANPKVLPLAADLLLLGFNGADETRRFQIGLAESCDGRTWRELPVNPLICTRRGLRVESCFLPRDSWSGGEQRAYYFEATEQDTFRSSRVLLARADSDGAWVGPPWTTRRPGLYRLHGDHLIAEPGVRDSADALQQTVPLERETQLVLRLNGGAGRGGARLVLVSEDATLEAVSQPLCPPGKGPGEGQNGRPFRPSSNPSLPGRGVMKQTLIIQIQRDGTAVFDGRVLASGTQAGSVSAVLRLINPTGMPEIALELWHEERKAVSLHEPLPWRPHTLRVELAVPPDEQALAIETCDIWQPTPCPVDGLADAHTGMGVVRSGDPLLPDIDKSNFLETLDRVGVGRALIVPYGSGGALDTFDQAAELLELRPGRLFPLLRVPQWTTCEQDEQFQVDQLELLWQQGLLAGLKVNLGQPERPSPQVLEWVAARQVLTHWHAGNDADLDWLEEVVLRRYNFPVLLAHFGGYPLARPRYQRCIDWLDRYPQTYLVTSIVFYRHYLTEAIRRHPTRVLLGSDFPGIDISAARAVIAGLDVPDDAKTLVLAENLRFLTERMLWHRRRQLHCGENLRFPLLPRDAREVAAQGFQIVPPPELPPEEDQSAKAYWSEHISDFYLKPKPWSHFVAHKAASLNVSSVPEFGCHAGRNLEAIRQRLPKAELVGLDINAAAVNAGRERFGLDLRVGDERTLSQFGDRTFDMVFTVSVLDHIPRIAPLCRELVRIARRVALFLEVTLPVEGKVLRHFDHQIRAVRDSTAASYSWRVDRYLRGHPRIWRLDCRPTYVQAVSLGPYYVCYVAWLDEH